MKTSLHIELTTVCNGVCFWCDNNTHNIKPRHLDIKSLKKILTQESLSKLEIINFLGRVGDASFYPDLFELLDHLKEQRCGGTPILMLHTNGSIRDAAWWGSLATKLLPGDKVVFAIDGLEDTHKIYRGVDFNIVLKNLRTFVEAGGKAVLQTVAFKHNQHQLSEIQKIVKDLGCEFLIYESDAYSEACQKPDDLGEFQAQVKAVGKFYISGTGEFVSLTEEELKNCKNGCLFHRGIFYIASNGAVFPCCFLSILNDDVAEVFKASAPFQFTLEYFRQAKNLNINTAPSLEAIVTHPFWKWFGQNNYRVGTCAERCNFRKS